MAPPPPEGPGAQGEANAGPAVFRRGSRDKKTQTNSRRARGKKRAEKGGGARGARARTKCPDAALRQSEARQAGRRGWGATKEPRGFLTLHSKLPGSVPPNALPE